VMLLTEYGNIDREEALYLAGATDSDMLELFVLASRAKVKRSGNRIDLCSIINAKSGACPEDCSFCAQSSHSKSRVHVYPLIDEDAVLNAARAARKYGVRRFCTVTSGRAPSDGELDKICRFTSAIRDAGLLPCATLGMLRAEQLKRLQDAGLNRYHHNLETSEAFFSEICTTHTYTEKIRTIEAAKSLGLSVCSGGIFGMGETWEDRIEMAFALRDIGVDSVPINFFTPVSGTSLGGRALLEPLDALKIIAIYRLILPQSEIRICGGRPATLRDLNSLIFLAGADGLLLGDYLTTKGRRPEDDLRMIRDMGLEI